MATSIGSTIASFGASFIPALDDTADIQVALKLLYYGTGGTLNNSNGIHGALYTLYTGNPTFAGNVTIGGNLTVNGTTTTINSTTITVDDILMELGAVASPSNTTANGGGISLLGTTNKTILWDSTNSNWTTSENWNLATGKTLKINNVDIASGTGAALVLGANASTSLALGNTSGTTTINGTLTLNNPNKTMTHLMGYTSTATAAGITTLTNTSSYYQQFTGTSIQTVVLPVTSTLATGWTFHIVNNSTGNLTVNSSGGNLVITVIPGTTAMTTCIGTTLTTAADWESGLTDFSTYTGTGNVVLSTSPTVTNITTAAGTTSLAPIKLTGTTNVVVSPTGGEIEFNGTNITIVPNTSIGRSTIATQIFTSGARTATGAGTELASTSYTMFPTANDTITLPVGTYKVDLFFRYDSTVSISGFTSLDIRGASGAAVGTMSWDGFSGAGNTQTSLTTTTQSIAATTLGTAIQIGNSTTGTIRTHKGTGILRITTAGTIIPSYQHSVNQTGTITLWTDNYLLISPVSSSTTTPITVGNWS